MRSVFVAAVSGALAACEHGNEPGPMDVDAGSHVGTDSGIESGVECCPPEPAPACCMAYGGAKQSQGCGKVCDGMPGPSDPAWRLVVDAFGCPRWSSAGSTGPCCGAPPRDAGWPQYSCYGDYGEPPRPLDAGIRGDR